MTLANIKRWRESPWVVCLLPFVIFMLVGSLEPSPPKPPTAEGEEAEKPWIDLGIEYRHYPLVYTAKIALVVTAMIFVWPGYRQYARGKHWAVATAVGVLGAVAWIVLSTWQREVVANTQFEWLKSLGERSAFNPLEQLRDQAALACGFLAVRLFGLVIVVPVIEEFFLRGFLMRFVMDERWWDVPFGKVNRLAVVVGTGLPVLLHPQEAVAALVWFSAVTWLMVRTRSIWACILAHAITNLSIGCYVIGSGQWWLM